MVILPAPETIAWVVQGEAGWCCEEAQIAVVHVLRNRAKQSWVHTWNQGWYGWQNPTEQIIEITKRALEMEDSTDGGLFLFSRQDVEKLTYPDGTPKAPWLGGYKSGKRWSCPGEGPDEWIEAWTRR